MTVYSVGEAAREVGCRARDVSDAFYDGALDDSQIIFAGNRRLIPEAYMATVRDVLAKRGRIRQVQNA